MRDIVSPCTHICRINPEDGKCIGCNRTTTEIALWSSMTNEERKAWFEKNNAEMLALFDS